MAKASSHVGSATGLTARLERASASGRIPRTPSVVRHPAAARPAEQIPPEELDELRGGPAREEDASLGVEAFTDELPPANPHDVQAALDRALVAQEVQEEDLDALWDAVRADADKGQQFLGVAPRTSAEMRAACAAFGSHFYVLIEDTVEGVKQRVGFAGFQSVNEKYMAAHLYLLDAHRGRAPRLIPQLMRMASVQYDGQTFVVQTPDMAMARMLKAAGFTASYLMQWVPRVMITPPTTHKE